MGSGEGWTIISDQQKGLVPAIHEEWPDIEHRQCARHIYSNWRKIHCGRSLQRQFWKCVKVTTMGEFAKETDILKSISNQAYEDFMSRDPNTFCKSHFKTHSKCDVVDNNMAETFNSFILLARYKPIVSMLEDIRLALMDRMQQKFKLLERFHLTSNIAPRIYKKLQEAYEEQKNCELHWSGTDEERGFEVKHGGISHDVSIADMTCTCRVWDLTGVPCVHAVSALLFMRKQPEAFVSEYYTYDTYLVTYHTLLNPVEGSKFWDMEGEDMVLPPNIAKKKLGRPKTARTRDPNEERKKSGKASRAGVPTKCSNCGQVGHTRRNCPIPRQTATQASQATEGVSTQSAGIGRPKGRKNRISQLHENSTNQDTPIPAALIRESRARRFRNIQQRGQVGGNGDGHSQVTGRGGTRGRGRGRSNASRIPEGYGLWQGDEGQMAYRASTETAARIIHTPSQNDSQVIE